MATVSVKGLTFNRCTKQSITFIKAILAIKFKKSLEKILLFKKKLR